MVHARLLLVLALAMAAGPASARPGDIETAFGVAGFVTTDPTVGWETARDGLVLPDGRMVVCGPGNANGAMHLVRYLENGTVDSTFGIHGVVVVTGFGSGTEATAIARQTDGKLVMAGHFFNGTSFVSVVLRFSESGALDISFGVAGRALQTIGPVGNVEDVVIQPDGRILIAGSFRTSGTITFVGLRRYLSTGVVDSTFGINGTVTRGPGTDNSGMAMRLLGDGRIMVVGSTDLNNGLGHQFLTFRFKPNGTPDSTFGTVGRVITNVSAFPEFARDVDVLPDGRILVAGHTGIASSTSHRYAVLCLQDTGLPDPAYGVGGLFLSPEIGVTTGYAFLNDQLLLPSGKVLLAGQGTRFGTSDDFALVSVGATGVIDTTFGTGGIVLTDLSSGGRDIAYRLLPRADGGVVAAGSMGTSLISGAPFVGLVGYRGDAPTVSVATETRPAGVALGAISPNPTRDVSRIALRLSAPGHARLEVFDPTGRRVATPLDARLAAGSHSVAWDTRDERGVRVGAGIYFCRLRFTDPAGRTGVSETRRIIVRE